jgi:hypothetical protein
MLKRVKAAGRMRRRVAPQYKWKRGPRTTLMLQGM